MKEILIKEYNNIKGKETSFNYKGRHYKIKKGRRSVVIYKDKEKLVFHKSMRWAWGLLYEQYLKEDI